MGGDVPAEAGAGEESLAAAFPGADVVADAGVDGFDVVF